ncbi:MAG: Gfo/Idh/MocA family oxidoreductase [Planctomycetota bacterium]|nr:Gfo/Idh/MocA family oxidoreductase [Planctomycetota bacterium]
MAKSTSRSAAKVEKPARVFDTDRRIRLGIWGLGRGMSFYKTCASLNIDVVAGCDYNEHMRTNFSAHNPGAFVTANADEFLAQDFDAVLLATFCPAHAPDAIRCMEAGKHVLSEVTAFHTMAEGVALIEAAQKTGKVYNLAENYPWTQSNMWLARKWKEGLFGDLMYAEYEYVHECRTLAYTYIDGKPVMPGHHVHSWRSWLNFHYYNTHSLGPVMIITGTRPVRTVALPGKLTLAGFAAGDARGMGGPGPSLLTMDNGGLVRNLMGATTNDTHAARLWGTLGAAQMVGQGLQLRLGASGHSPMYAVRPTWDELGTLAASSGHGGGDFWVLYYFAREILYGTPAPWNLFASADVTIPGIQAYRSALQDGQPMECPDFRDPKQRDKYRNDNWAQEHLNPREWAFPATADLEITKHFSTIMSTLIRRATQVRAVADWLKVADEAIFDVGMVELLGAFITDLPAIKENYAKARALINTYPTANAARSLREMLEVGLEKEVVEPAFLANVKKALAKLRKTLPASLQSYVEMYEASPLLPVVKVKDAKPPAKSVKFKRVAFTTRGNYADVRGIHNGKNGLIYVRAIAKISKAGTSRAIMGADGPVRIWINGKLVATDPKGTNPVHPARYSANVRWKKGRNEILFALASGPSVWGVSAAIDKVE